jgi:hypothetical protein
VKWNGEAHERKEDFFSVENVNILPALKIKCPLTPSTYTNQHHTVLYVGQHMK